MLVGVLVAALFVVPSALAVTGDEPISTVAGGGSGGDNAAATLAQLKLPADVAVDAAGNLYIAEFDNHRVRKVDAATQVITTVAGNGTAGFAGDGGAATSAQLNKPLGVTVDAAGSLYIADFNNHRVRKVTPPDSEAPVVSDVVASPNPVEVDTAITLSAVADDVATGGSTIASAGYQIDGGVFVEMAALDGGFDEVTEDLTASVTAFAVAGVHEVCVRATDAAANTSGVVCTILAVFDPDGGFVTGGGWIDSPAAACPVFCAGATGKASFGFVSKYQRGASVPTGNTEFQFKAGDLRFKSTSYEWLVIAGARAQFKGNGTINGAGDYNFLLTAVDGALPGDGGSDKFRIKITGPGGIVYDNQHGEDENGPVSTELGGGSIKIHKG